MGFEHVVLEETSLGLTPAILSSRRDSKAPLPPPRRRASQTREGEARPPRLVPTAVGSGDRSRVHLSPRGHAPAITPVAP